MSYSGADDPSATDVAQKGFYPWQYQSVVFTHRLDRPAKMNHLLG